MIRFRKRCDLREALALIARGGCTKNNDGDQRCWDDQDKIRGGHYVADAWCAPCIAQDALDGRGSAT